MLGKLRTYRNQILFIELAGLLHDIGKLSKVFLEYRQTWQDDPHGYDNDPHDHSYLERYEVFKDLIPSEFKKKPDEIPSLGKGGCMCWEPDFTIEKAVHFHTKPGDMAINKMLNAADGIDAAIDRNNPLFSAEQKDTVFRSNVFGYEKERIVTFESQEDARQKLYSLLHSKLSTYFKDFDDEGRLGIIKDIKDAFQKGIADTTRPSNDTTLWEHSYAVASILKVLAVHNLLNDDEKSKIDNFKKVKFGILGIGWDGMRFISYGQKIGDIVGRKEVIENIKHEIKKIVEDKYPIGNEIYADDNGIYFIVPVNLKNNLNSIWNEIEKDIYKATAENSEGEIQPYLVYIDRLKGKEKTETELSENKSVYMNTLTQLCRVIKEMIEKISHRYDSNAEGFKESKDFLKYANGKTICPICRQRPVDDEAKKGAAKKTKVKKKLCKICIKRRNNKGRKIAGETIFIDEIVDENRRAALIVARFVLDDWLSGNMVRSLFITEANGLCKEVSNLGNVKQFENDENKIKKFLEEKKLLKFNYERIRADIDSLFEEKDKERAEHTVFLYDQRAKKGSLFRNIHETKENWRSLLEQAKNENDAIDIYNLLNAKTPTPSTIFDVWETTLEFVQDIPKDILRSLLPENKRLELTVELKEGENIDSWDKGTVEAEVVSTKEIIEILYKGQDTFEVVGEMYLHEFSENKWSNKQKPICIKIIDKESDSFGNLYEIKYCNAGDTTVPYRTITESPNLFMAIVPAKRAIEISDLIYQKYREHFGKVMGRLPFSIGNIFFGSKMPMFVVLDAGKRMIANFDNLADDKNKKAFYVNQTPEYTESNISFDLTSSLGKFCKTLTWQLPYKLGNCDKDYHHPYFIVGSGGKDLSTERFTFFKTIAGDVIHFTEIKEGDKLCVHPNYYDFEFLDSNTRRHDIHLKDGRRKSNVAAFKSKPFLLDELNQKIMRLWKEFMQGKQLKGITDTKLRNLQSLWLTKYQEWNVDIGNKRYEQWVNLVTSSIQKEFNELDNEQYNLLRETIGNGLFFDMLELYLGILKERIQTK
ncbi:MAG: CRISPR-associated protein Csx11 [Candidatus Brocadia sp. AMX2]|uniref:CRISPR-associated protein Csx11 n=1 Tax=Candidatus Brocadia sinica JPN1 TaxID=1197129 RepID=A0ABQ0JSR0_9BACT|nr:MULTISPECIES: CRISPR-associated protein Csx11 [Brocadia]KXK25956.1 MAG: hypothetical protein UZ01_03189 [Candidatus Brocadia sinica]MBC6933656.1 CRISPR-associated protein Csx11 [Candidatus Brocadia sp.]MBL1170508.1 CRISPR-associated protein Csx11 [Candidatus Brocadia sp. AMX1]NOG43347.1 CRISPR-associated protein Csx11 [Planctomycetota bacterium]KAA0243319.1 MAG: CRISPR-associated protein Csx11 [Candidatus Brocadia sp. AMX2]